MAQAWILQHAVSSVLEGVTGGNVVLGDFYTFCVLGGDAPKGQDDLRKGWPPHRDRCFGSTAWW